MNPRPGDRRSPEKRPDERHVPEDRGPEERTQEERTQKERGPEKRSSEKRASEKRTSEKRTPEKRPAERRAAERPRRQMVTSPRTLAARRPRHSPTREIDEQTQLGEVYMRSLVRTQLRLGLFVCTLLGCVVGGLPLLFLLVPGMREIAVLGLPLPWVLLGGLIYPLFVLGGYFYVRSAERNERDFADLVDRP